MITLRKAEDRGRTRIGWLDSRHNFSFGEYHDPAFMGFESLRVLNDDRVAPGRGFGAHGHANMEIISVVLSGALEHKDSMGNGSIIRAGDVQRMSAGTGVTHSEFNPSPDEEVHFLQIWFLPRARGLAPGYEQKTFADADRRGRWTLVASPDGRDGSLSLNQDVDMYVAALDGAASLNRHLAPGRKAWLHLARGKATLNGHPLQAGDGAAIAEEAIEVSGDEADIILFDIAPLIST